MNILVQISKLNLVFVALLHFVALFILPERALILASLITCSLVLSVLFLFSLVYMRFYAKDALMRPSTVRRVNPVLVKVIIFYFIGLFCFTMYRGAWAKIIAEDSQTYLATSSGIKIRTISNEEAMQIQVSRIQSNSAVAIIFAYMAFLSIFNLSMTLKAANNKRHAEF